MAIVPNMSQESIMELVSQLAAGPIFGITPEGDISFEVEKIAEYRYWETIRKLRMDEPPLPEIRKEYETPSEPEWVKEFETVAFLSKLQLYKQYGVPYDIVCYEVSGLQEGPKYYDWED